MRSLFFTSLLMMSATAEAAVQSKKISYELDGQKFESVLLSDDAQKGLPGLVLVPNWLGINDANLKQAQLIASRGYVVLVADVFGVTGRPKGMDDAGKISGALKSDRPLLRKRVAKAYEQLLAQKLPAFDGKRTAAIGFCFGGTAALELARSGAKLGATVTFHAGLGSPTPDDAKHIEGKVLALHGADDPFVPPDEVRAFQDEMRNAKLDWQLVSFGNAVHSFTDVDANVPGKQQYNPVVTKRAYQLMDTFLAEAFVAK